MSRHRKLALAATVLMLVLVPFGCGSRSSSTSRTDLPNAIQSALDTGNPSQLRTYLAPSVDYAIAASGAYGTLSPDGAIKQLTYFKDDRGPWNFAIPAATLESFKSGSYRRYLGNYTYFGVSPAKGFMSVRVNSVGQIDQIFMAINTDLLK